MQRIFSSEASRVQQQWLEAESSLLAPAPPPQHLVENYSEFTALEKVKQHKPPERTQGWNQVFRMFRAGKPGRSVFPSTVARMNIGKMVSKEILWNQPAGHECCLLYCIIIMKDHFV